MLEVVLRGIADDDMVEIFSWFHLFHSVRSLAAIDFESAKVRHFFETWEGYVRSLNKESRQSIDIRSEVDPNDNEYHCKENVTCRNQKSAELLELELMDHIPKIQR